MSQNVFRHGKKIWLTEFAMSGTSDADKVVYEWNIHHNQVPSLPRTYPAACIGNGGINAQVLEFMQDILPMLEAHEGVYKYSWFMNRFKIFGWAIWNTKWGLKMTFRFAETNDHGCPFEDNNKAWWVGLNKAVWQIFNQMSSWIRYLDIKILTLTKTRCLDKVNSLLEVNMDESPTLTKLGLFYSQFGKWLGEKCTFLLNNFNCEKYIIRRCYNSFLWFGFGQQRNIILQPGSAESIMGMIDDLYRR